MYIYIYTYISIMVNCICALNHFININFLLSKFGITSFMSVICLWQKE